LTQLKSTEPADRARAEAGARRMAGAAGFKEPERFRWFDSPQAASWALAVVVARGYPWTSILAPSALTSDERTRLDQARSALGSVLGTTDDQRIMAAFGASRVSSLVFPADPRTLFSGALLNERFDLYDDVSLMVQIHDDELERAESHFWRGSHAVLSSGLYGKTSKLITQSYLNDHWFSMMADDEQRIGNRPAPPFLSATLEVARAAGLWWPFENVVVFAERPAELHFNDQQLLHSADGPAIVYRDGMRVYAWNGKAVPERWIMEPEAVPPREFKGFDPTFRKHVESRGGKGKSTAPAAKVKRAKPTSILEAVLPTDHVARIAQIREHTSGKLPLFDRYVAGEHEVVWKELVALGSSVRDDPHAADALAVAYETMYRVEQNVRTLVKRLTTMGYRFTPNPGASSAASTGVSGLASLLASVVASMASSGGAKPTRKADPAPHVPPTPAAQKQVADFERRFGTLPLSLRAFYEVVGEVNLIGTHPSIDPPDNAVAADPLVVYGLDEGLVEFDEEDEDGDGEPNAITIAPDDLHKANVSGGDPYEMAIPDLRADGELLNERHELFFVDYLRLCFKFGGFPGYEAMGTIPAELGRLSAGLTPF
jgi:hypothetical protein